MKVYLGPYKNWIGPYQIADMIFFWKDKYAEDHEASYNLGCFLSKGWAGYKLTKDKMKRHSREYDNLPYTWFHNLLEYIQDKRERTIKVQLHKYDTWSMDSTLSVIILPLLKQLKATTHGSATVDLSDVPFDLRATEPELYSSQLHLDFGDTPAYTCGEDGMVHKRWNWVLDEMIWTFQQLQPDSDWESQYHKGEYDWISEPCKFDGDGVPALFQLKKGPNDTSWFDKEGFDKHADRITNGLRLFGKYFQGLWD